MNRSRQRDSRPLTDPMVGQIVCLLAYRRALFERFPVGRPGDELATQVPINDGPGRRDGELCLRLPADPSALAAVRKRVSAFLERNGIGATRARDALLVVHELAANAIRHGSESGDEIGVRAQILERRLCVTVSDRARRGTAPVVLPASEVREGGRGLKIVDRLAAWSDLTNSGGDCKLYAELDL